MGTVVKLRECAPEWELARLKRETGLTFARLPVSLLSREQLSSAQEPIVVPARNVASLLAVRR